MISVILSMPSLVWEEDDRCGNVQGPSIPTKMANIEDERSLRKRSGTAT